MVRDRTQFGISYEIILASSTRDPHLMKDSFQLMVFQTVCHSLTNSLMHLIELRSPSSKFYYRGNWLQFNFRSLKKQ